MELEDLKAKAAIEDALHSYCRGIDRCEPEAIKAAFHEDGELVDYGSAERQLAGPFAEYAAKKLHETYIATQHRITNTKIERSGDNALAETYILAFHVQETSDGKVLHTFNGRWLDTFERRNGDWRIAERVLRMDWSRRDPWNEDMAGNYITGARDSSDVLYSLMPD
ncbi:MAG: nuclear transport factor 2 family protein [Acidimicrobiales bacterium]